MSFQVKSNSINTIRNYMYLGPVLWFEKHHVHANAVSWTVFRLYNNSKSPYCLMPTVKRENYKHSDDRIRIFFLFSRAFLSVVGHAFGFSSAFFVFSLLKMLSFNFFALSKMIIAVMFILWLQFFSLSDD